VLNAVYIWGHNKTFGLTFGAHLVGGARDIELPLKPGVWNFKVMAWSGGANMFEGITRCGGHGDIAFQSGDIDVPIHLTTDCSHPFVSGGGTNFLYTNPSPPTANQIKPLRLVTCTSLALAQAPGDLCTDVYLGNTRSFRVVLPSYLPRPEGDLGGAAPDSLRSECQTVDVTPADTNLHIPVGNDSPESPRVNITAFSTSDCSGPTVFKHYPFGLLGAKYPHGKLLHNANNGVFFMKHGNVSPDFAIPGTRLYNDHYTQAMASFPITSLIGSTMNPSPVTHMCAKIDAAVCSGGDWIPFNSSHPSVTVPDGAHTISVYLKDGDANVEVITKKVFRQYWSDMSGGGAPPTVRSSHGAVWADNKMMIWGGVNGAYLQDGGFYIPGSGWFNLSSIGAVPVGRIPGPLVWAWGKLMVWGGKNAGPLNSGGQCLSPCISDSWTATTGVNAPTIRFGHSALWTGSEVIIFGGRDGSSAQNNGAKFNGTSWSYISNGPARHNHSAVWTGTHMLIWGGFTDLGGVSPLADGSIFNGATWQAMGGTPPAARGSAVSVWTGSEMIVWGGSDGVVPLSDGKRYDPISDTWTDMSTATGAPPIPRYSAKGVWTGKELIIFGGVNPPSTYLTNGKAYDPVRNEWNDLSSTGEPLGRAEHSVIWTGQELIVWGGQDNGIYKNDGKIYHPYALPY